MLGNILFLKLMFKQNSPYVLINLILKVLVTVSDVQQHKQKTLMMKLIISSCVQPLKSSRGFGQTPYSMKQVVS